MSCVRPRIDVLLLVCFFASGLIAQGNSDKTPAKIADLNWLAGSWSGEIDGTITEEQWLVPRAGMMVGVNRTTFPNGKATFEFLRIAETDKGLTYFASPTGKPATPFLVKTIEKQKVVFENTSNDFPHRILYERVDDTLVASIEGEIKGKSKSMKWTWKRSTVAP